MIGPLVALLVLLACGVGAQEAATPLPIGETPAPTAHGGDATLPVPSTLTICIDRTAQRCWSAVMAAECARRSQGGAEIFASVPANSPEAGNRLRACWDEVKH
jgi:hypothetical protein